MGRLPPLPPEYMKINENVWLRWISYHHITTAAPLPPEYMKINENQ